MSTQKISITILLVMILLGGNLLGQNFTQITSGAIVNDGGQSYISNWIDYDNDGNLDLFVANFENNNNFLYHNNGDGTFTKITSGIIVNDHSNSLCCSWGDYDNDGYPDLYISNWGALNFLYHNEGNGTFEKVTTGAIATDWSLSNGSAWGDYNNDGYLDLFVACRTGADNLLYQNNGNGTFTKMTSGSIVNDGGNSFGCSWADYDNDGWLDLFVANGGFDAGQNNFLYHNNGNGTFTKISSGIIVNDGGKSFGGSWGDYDNDGDLDLFVASDAPDFDRLYQNNGNGTFSKVTSGQIVSEGNTFYSGWVDYENDGDLDLYLIKDWTNGPLFRNNGNGTFTKITTGNFLNDHPANQGFSWGDYDNDGDIDLFLAHNGNYNNTLFANNGNNNNWINIKCVGVESNKAAIGAKVHVKAELRRKSVWQMQEISGQTGGGMGSQNSINAEFGLRDASIIDSIKIEWPSGIIQVLTEVEVNQFLTIREEKLPDIVIFPRDTLDFRETYVGFPATRYVEIANRGGGTLFVTAQLLDGVGFTVLPDTFWLKFQEAAYFSVVFNPTAVQTYSGKLLIISNDPQKPRILICLEGEGVLPPDISVAPDSLSETLFMGGAAIQKFTISNTGNSPLQFYLWPRENQLLNLTTVSAESNPATSENLFPDLTTENPPGNVLPGVQTEFTESMFLGNERFTNSLTPTSTAPKTLLISASGSQYDFTAYAKDALISTGLFSATDIDIIEAPVGLPIADLAPYEVVLVWANEQFHNPVSLGTVLKQFVDFGGGVVIATYSLSPQLAIQGGILASDYSPFIPARQKLVSGVIDLKNLPIPDHPIFSNINTVPTYWVNDNYSNPYLNSGGTLLAVDTEGNNVVAVNPNGRVVGITIFPGILGNSKTNSATRRLFANALYFVRNWFTLNLFSGTIPANTSVEITVKFNAFNLNSDDYQNDIVILSNDPDEQLIKLPVNLSVQDAPDILIPIHQLEFEEAVVGMKPSIEFSIENHGSEILELTEITVDDTVFTITPSTLSIAPDSQKLVTVTFQAPDSGKYSATLTLRSNDPDEEIVTIPLVGNAINMPLALFSQIDVGLQPLRNGSVDWGDYDNDGDLDVLLTGRDDENVYSIIYRNDSNDIFTAIAAPLTPVRGGSGEWGDYDNDGDLDILLTGQADDVYYALIYRNDGNDTFTDIQADLINAGRGAAAWGDYDNDGDLDLLLTGFNGSANYSLIYRNEGNDIFTNINADLIGVGTGAVSWGDYDTDGDLDILLTGRDESNVYTIVYRNDNNGIFTDIEAPLQSVWDDNTATWVDYDNDGDLDITLIGRTDLEDTRCTLIYRNDGADIFTKTQVYMPSFRDGVAAWGDYDNDGYPDLLISGLGYTDDQTLLYRNEGNDKFSETHNNLPDLAYTSAEWGDYDNDGKLDLVMIGRDNDQVYHACIYRNESAVVNNIPNPPTNLLSSFSAGTLTLSWSSATDQETPAAGLSYNLWIGTTPIGNEIMSSHADNITGWRRICAIGNVQKDTCWTIHNLDSDSVYYWSVQAIDAAYAGSQWASSMNKALGKMNSAMPRQFSLSQNYPNPFNPTTAIKYELAKDSDVTLKIYDLLGREIRTLVDAHQKAGRYIVPFDASKCASGIYFYKLVAPGYFEAIKKMILLQ